MANRILSEYKDACSLPALSPAPSLMAWQAPPSGFFKINTDGAASDGSPSCTGVAIPDCSGCLIAALSNLLPSSYSAEITEALALQDGVLLALELGISHVIVESDALSIIQAINEDVFGGVAIEQPMNLPELLEIQVFRKFGKVCVQALWSLLS
nr:hypothetical protein CFP56_68205 [Quercus suber]